MSIKSFQTARRLGDSRSFSVMIVVCGVASALLVPLMTIVFGGMFATALPAEDGVVAFAGVPGSAVLTATLGGIEAPRQVLATLVIVGLALAALECVLVWQLSRAGRAAAIELAIRLTTRIREQAFRVGTVELLRERETLAEVLTRRAVPRVRAGAVAWHRAMPRTFVLAPSLLLVAAIASVWLTAVCCILVAFTWILHRWMQDRAERQRAYWSDQAAIEQEAITGPLRQVPLVVGFGKEALSEDALTGPIERYRQAALKAAAAGLMIGPFLRLFGIAGASVVVLLCGVNILAGNLTIAGCATLIASLACGFFPIRRLIMLPDPLAPAETAAGDILAYLDRDPAIAQATDAQPLTAAQTRIFVEGVNFADRLGNRLLHGATATLPAKGRTALMSTDPRAPLALAGLLLRYDDPAAGRLLFDDRELRLMTVDSVRRATGFVAADGMLLSGTVTENIRCGSNDFTQLQVIDAAKEARAYNFIQQLPNGFSTPVGVDGHRLRPGEAFRIGLARVALRNPVLIVAEEPTEAMDEVSGGHVDEALRRLAQDRAIVILPSRLETLRNADHVVVLDNGSVVAEGKHADLVQRSELYRHLTYVRFNAFQR
jgi:ABC-type multidrug transport system fused ATPase/permease subunit